MEKSLTVSQKNAVYSNKKNLLIAASAGCGKTSTMMDRITETVLNGASLKNILVVTFAKAAADEMKERLKLSLINKSLDERVKKELTEIENAGIGTLHSFCTELIRKYFYATSLSGGFTVLEEVKSKLLKEEVLNELFDELYESADDKFYELIDFFGKKRNDFSLKEIVLKIYNFSRSLKNPEEFLKTAAKYYGQNNPTVLGLFKKEIDNCVKNAKQILDRCMMLVTGQKGYEKVFEVLNFDLETLNGILDGNCINAIENLKNVKFQTFKGKPKEEDTELYEQIKKYRKKAVDSVNALKKTLLTDSLEETFLNSKIAKVTVENLCGIVIEFSSRYQEKLKEKNAVDFDSLQFLALEILSNKVYQKEINEQYKYVFVDEYQDINEVQEAIISLVRGENLFCVGDIKQSIYGFRQCDGQIFKAKSSEYANGKNAETIYLKDNFRSLNHILDFVNCIFSGLFTSDFGGEDYEKNSCFVGNRKDGKDEKIEIFVVNNKKEEEKREDEILPYSVTKDKTDRQIKTGIEKEAKIVARIIKDSVNKKFLVTKDGERLLKYKDVTILMRSLKEDSDLVLKILKEEGIPVVKSGDCNILEFPEVNTVFNLLKLFDNRKQDISLISVMRNIFSFSDEELSKIRKSGVKYKFFHEAVFNYKEEKDLKSRIDSFIDFLDYYQSYANLKGGARALREALNHTDFTLRQIKEGEGKAERIDGFLSLLSELPGQSICSMVENIEKLNEVKVPEVSEASDSVKVMTIHASKGLEFPYVFLMGAGKSFNNADIKSDIIITKDLGVASRYFSKEKREKEDIPVYVAAKLLVNEKRAEEEMRILYVALTRGINKLFITGSKNTDDSGNAFFVPKQEKADNYLDWILGSLFKRYPSTTKMNRELKTFVTFCSDEEEKVEKDQRGFPVYKAEKTGVKELINNYNFKYDYIESTKIGKKYSVTEINKEEENNENSSAVKEEIEELDESIAEYSDAFDKRGRGIVYHKVLELLDIKKVLNGEDLKADLEEVFKKSNFTEEEKKIIDIRILEKLFNLELLTSVKDYEIFREKRFIINCPACDVINTKACDDVLVQGIIDFLAVDKNTKTAVLLDFKVSVLSEEKLKKKYRKQLEIYKKAVESILGLKVIKTSIVDVLKAKEIVI